MLLVAVESSKLRKGADIFKWVSNIHINNLAEGPRTTKNKSANTNKFTTTRNNVCSRKKQRRTTSSTR